MADRSDGSRRLVPVVATMAIIALAVILVAVQFARQRREGADRERAGGSTALAPNARAKEPAIKSVGVATAEPILLDLDGEREPTEDELIRAALERYLAALRGATAANVDKAKAYLRNKAALEELLRSLPPSAVPTIARLLREEPDDLCRRILIYGLADMGTDEAAKVLRDYFLDRIHDASYRVELGHLVRALGMCDAGRAYDALVDFLTSDDTAVRAMRPNYVESLGKHRRGPEALPIFYDLLGTEGHDMVRNKAAQAVKNVAKRDPAAAAPALANLIEGYRGEQARQLARRDQGSEPVFYIKQTTLGAIGQLGNSAAVPFLLEVGMTEPIDERLSAAAALSRIGGEEATAALKEIFANTDAKPGLIDAISQLREPRAIPFLHDVATSADSSDVRRGAIRAIALVGGDDAVSALRQVMAVEQTDAVRHEAAASLDRLTGGRR